MMELTSIAIFILVPEELKDTQQFLRQVSMYFQELY